MKALVKGNDLLAPQPGYFIASVKLGDVVHAGSTLGTLEILGKVHALHAGDVGGTIVALDTSRAKLAVDYGARLATVDPDAVTQRSATAAADAKVAGNAFRAPTSGRFYGRSSPDKPAFVAVGDTLQPGATICLLEVMKTFHRVTYAGEPARVKAVLVADGADVNQGDPLLALE